MSPSATPPTTPARLRELLARVPETGPVILPGAYDGLSARLVEAAGFDAVYMTGFGSTATLLGKPDVGLLSGSEMADNARRLASAVGIPLVADADTGYGNAVNVARTVAEYERAGVAGIQLEDQVSPKKCGHMAGKAIVPAAEMVGKLHAAVDARRDPDLVLIARTDAIAVDGVDAAIERARAYLAAGADALFVEAPTSEADVERIAGELAGEAPLVFNWVEGGRTPPIDVGTIGKLGFAMVLFPIGALLAATAGMRNYLAELSARGTVTKTELPTFEEFTDLVGLPEIREQERRYAAGDQAG
ncbi:isocitrate lyase/PEP mutase family protein [Pseudonocardia sp.]|jgi:2-methylisocitrate lyase-like PEP mutase family enzyme|uniref:isocitrate lyase/PEP mutase family protein n=1 Tax=Pseudonocardia sp. TaxID=60912 RepID=UPI0031FC77C0